jgi:nicotinamide riboside kinase
MAKKIAKTKKRIILTGAQGTGKTTLMNALCVDGTKMLSVARTHATNSGWKDSNDTTTDYQKDLFRILKKELSSKKNYVSDRGLTCVAAYTFDKAVEGSIPKKVADKQYLDMVKFARENPDILIVYVPVEFDPVEDGVRSTDVIKQARIDFFIKNILDTAQIPYITVRGTVEERVAQVEAALTNNI